jgi:beta-mannosidase
MKRTLITLTISLLILIPVRNYASVNKIEIKENWQFRQVGTNDWFPATVPGCVHTDLIDNKKIEDPFYRVNEKNDQWIGEKDWEYKTTFIVDKSTLEQENIRMVFKGLDTYADIYINDSLILKTDNMHREWTLDCKNILVEGKNTIRICFNSVFKVNIPKYLNSPFKLQAWMNNDQSDIWLSVYTRKAGFHFGWDWGPRLITCGIWRPISLESWSNGRISDIQIIQKSVSPKIAKIIAVFEIESDKDQSATLSVNLQHKSLVSQKQLLKKGLNSIPVEFEITNPKLWWSNGLGKPNMYAFDCNIKSDNLNDTKTVRAGIRSLKIVRDSDENGKSLYVLLNGVPVFMKGASYIPLNNFQNKVNTEKYEYYIQSAVASNMNMLRVWGGGIYEDDYFYDLCDKNGILVWQDMMFACGMFPMNKEFIETVQVEISQNIKRLRNHPSIALWNGNNENEISWYGWGWKNQYNDNDQKTYQANLRKLFYDIVPNAIYKSDTTRYYHPTSPNSNYNDIPISMGDVHYWDTKGDAPLESYNKVIGRFMSEYGFQSYPEISTIDKFTQDWERNKKSEVLFAHNRAKDDNTRDPNFGNEVIEKKMKSYYPIPENFESYIYMSQLLQAKASKIAIEAHRRNKPFCMGSLYWQINDCWPAVSWSSIDFYGNWKAAQYTIRDVFKTVITPVIIEENKLRVYIVSDSLNMIDGKLTIRLKLLSGEPVFAMDKDVKVTANSSKVYYEIDPELMLKNVDKENVVLSVSLEANNHKVSENLFYFVPEKMLKLKIPTISTTVVPEKEGCILILKTDVLAKNIYLNDKGIEGSYTDNYFDLLPGETKKVYFKPSNKKSDLKNNFSIKTMLDNSK